MEVRIVHVSGDFPDPVVPEKTPVIRRLVDLTADRFDHHVLSINRRPPGARGYLPPAAGMRDPETAAIPFDYGEAITYRAPPSGIWHRRYLEGLGEAVARRLRGSGRPPALLVGHKLTIEGIAVAAAAARLGVPYAITIQGNTDTRILAVRPDLRAVFARIFHGAATVFSFAPWATAAVERVLGARKDPCIVLPCPRERDVILAPRVGGSGLVSAFHLDNWRTKNLDGLLAAHRLAERSGHPMTLAIVGGGTDEARAHCRRIADTAAAVEFEGPLDNAAVPARFNAATALVVPSRRESFGLVFVEALCAGLPIVYPEGRAVAGYFDGEPFALPVRPDSPRDIAAAMVHAAQNEASMKQALAQWQAGPGPRRFAREVIAASFAQGLSRAIRTAPAQ